jgi:hypothetical protein
VNPRVHASEGSPLPLSSSSPPPQKLATIVEEIIGEAKSPSNQHTHLRLIRLLEEEPKPTLRLRSSEPEGGQRSFLNFSIKLLTFSTPPLTASPQGASLRRSFCGGMMPNEPIEREEISEKLCIST